MIRTMKFGDIPRVVFLFQEAQAKSRKYAGRATIDLPVLKARVLNAVKSHGSPHEGGSWCMVAEKDGIVEGFIIGMLTRIQDIGHEFMASDWKFIVSERGNVGDAGALRDSFIAWAKSNPRVIEICVAVHDDVGEDWERAAALWRRRGFVQTGGIYESAVTPAEEQVA